MQPHLNSTTNVWRSEVDNCAYVTKLSPARKPGARAKRYEGMLAVDIRVGVPLILMLNGKRRLVTSTIRKIQPVSAELMEVETSNSRYSVRRFLPESLLETDDCRR